MSILLYTDAVCSRLNYVAQVLSAYWGVNITVTDIRPQDPTQPVLVYRQETEPNFPLQIVPAGLLGERGVRALELKATTWAGEPVLFPTAGTVPADILSALFFLISRYEEYWPGDADMYGRYDYRRSWLHQQGQLHRPLAQVWMWLLGKEMQRHYPQVQIRLPEFSQQPSFDIDMGWLYLHKPWWLQLWYVRKRDARNVLRGLRRDPADIFSWLDELHDQAGVQPHFFFHVGATRGKYDKQIPPQHEAMQELVRQVAKRYPVGLHPSWRSGDEPHLLQREWQSLSNLVGYSVTDSRQHYIRWQLPDTFHRLLSIGITNDYSMGYGSTNGFRAGMAMPFRWYDLSTESTTALMLHPFVYMEANSIFEHRESPNDASAYIQSVTQACQLYGGPLMSVWHNMFLADTPTGQPWRNLYTSLILRR